MDILFKIKGISHCSTLAIQNGFAMKWGFPHSFSCYILMLVQMLISLLHYSQLRAEIKDISETKDIVA